MSTFGWRWWDLSSTGSLQSVNHVLWEPNEPIRASCMRHGVLSEEGWSQKKQGSASLAGKAHDLGVPWEDCTCGTWAFYDPELAEGLPHQGGYFKTCKVFGVVEAWGGIVWHEWGFRAEWITIRGVCVMRGRLHPAYEMPRYRTVDELCNVWDVEPLADEGIA